LQPGYSSKIPTGPDSGEHIPLSCAQERLWFLDQLGLTGAAYNQLIALRLCGNLDVEALEHCFDHIVHRHEILRTTFVTHEGEPYQLVDPDRSFGLHHVDLSSQERDEDEVRRLRECLMSERRHRFDLQRGPLIRAVLVKLKVQEHALLVGLHHIISDGWSLEILLHELRLLYAARVRGEKVVLPPLPMTYAEYAILQRRSLQGEGLQRQLRYWRDQLKGAPPQLQLPLDRQRPVVESFAGAVVQFELDAETTTVLKGLCRAEGTTLFMLFVAAYQLLLSRWSGERDVLVGTPIAGRGYQELEGVFGCFVNTLVIRSQVEEEATFREFLWTVRKTTLDAFAAQDVPFEVVVKELRPARDLARQPIFQVALAMQNYPSDRFELAGLTWEWLGVECVSTHFDLMLYLSETANGVSGTFEYATALFEKDTIERLSHRFSALVTLLGADPDRRIDSIPFLTKQEEARLQEWNAATASLLRFECVHQLVEAQVDRDPGAVAILHGERSVTYAELDARANMLARYLRARGAGPDRLIAVCIERSIEMVLALLGILKAGAAYVPLDPSYPRDRLEYMLNDSSPQLVLTQGSLATLIPSTHEVIQIDTALMAASEHSHEKLESAGVRLTRQNLVYVIYTSGSTGRPKGTAMTHRAMVNLVEWHQKKLPRMQRVAQFAALSFDVAFQEIFTTLASGGSLVMMDEWIRRDAIALLEFIRINSIQRLFLPPLVLQALAENISDDALPPSCLNDVITAGEQLKISPEMLAFFKGAPGCRLHNHYGPTESHVVTALTLSGDPSRWPTMPPIGWPLSNTRIYVLDSRCRPMPIGGVGEIYIGGHALARGYLRQPTLTAQRFTADGFQHHTGATLYRSGDMGRWREDGSLEYLGRNDDQVKVRGYRIELGEIEAQLSLHKAVSGAVVLVREDESGDKRVVAYVTLRGETSVATDELRTQLRATLPEHMVPSAIVVLSDFPRTPSGKVDRRLLPAPDLRAVMSTGYEAPQGPVEELLATIWRELLSVERVGRSDNFFELGGHSLLGIKLVAQVTERMSVRISAISIFQYPTIEQMAELVTPLMHTQRQHQASGEQIERGTI
jgi:amino acid adenylation domain-containing protein